MLQFVPSLVLLVSFHTIGLASAFTTSGIRSTKSTCHSRVVGGGGGPRQNDAFVLGPVARNGLEYEDVELGQGRRVLPGDTVSCYYVGSFQTKKAAPVPSIPFFGGALGGGGGGGASSGGDGDRTVFDEVTEGQPFSFVVGKNQVIKGWDLGILGGLEGEISPMNVGGVRLLSIPSGLAYGPEGAGPIPPNQDLQFEVQVIDARKDSSISLQYRLGGFAVAFTVPAVILFIVYNVLQSLN